MNSFLDGFHGWNIFWQRQPQRTPNLTKWYWNLYLYITACVCSALCAMRSQRNWNKGRKCFQKFACSQFACETRTNAGGRRRPGLSVRVRVDLWIYVRKLFNFCSRWKFGRSMVQRFEHIVVHLNGKLVEWWHSSTWSVLNRSFSALDLLIQTHTPAHRPTDTGHPTIYNVFYYHMPIILCRNKYVHISPNMSVCVCVCVCGCAPRPSSSSRFIFIYLKHNKLAYLWAHDCFWSTSHRRTIS